MSDVACPECTHHDVKVELACHTWPQTRGNGTEMWMSCQGCDSALEYLCTCWLDDDTDCQCMWRYTHGLNPRNPRHAHCERSRPTWIEGDLKFGEHSFPVKHEGVPWFP
jgi:hypothetical protein